MPRRRPPTRTDAPEVGPQGLRPNPRALAWAGWLACGAGCGPTPRDEDAARVDPSPPPTCLAIPEAEALSSRVEGENRAREDARLDAEGLVRVTLDRVTEPLRHDIPLGEWGVVDRVGGGRTLVSPIASATCLEPWARPWTLTKTIEGDIVPVVWRHQGEVRRPLVCGCPRSACGTAPNDVRDQFELASSALLPARVLSVDVDLVELDWRGPDGGRCPPAP